jgi:hypothetical protein
MPVSNYVLIPWVSNPFLANNHFQVVKLFGTMGRIRRDKSSFQKGSDTSGLLMILFSAICCFPKQLRSQLETEVHFNLE